jgi:hypothetical protein
MRVPHSVDLLSFVSIALGNDTRLPSGGCGSLEMPRREPRNPGLRLPLEVSYDSFVQFNRNAFYVSAFPRLALALRP